MKRRTLIRNSIAGAEILSSFPYESLALKKKIYPKDIMKQNKKKNKKNKKSKRK